MKLLSIITIYDGSSKEQLEATLLSVDSQDSSEYQHIVVAANIATPEEFVGLYSEDRRIFHINVDNGLYNAMNIGLDAATGTHVLFMNSGDEFYNSSSISLIIDHLELNQAASFSSLQHYKGDYFLRHSYLENPNSTYAHQSFVAPLTSVAKFKFDESRKFDADSLWIKSVCSHQKYKVVGEVVARFSLGGISNCPSLKTIALRYKYQGAKRGLLEMLKWSAAKTLGMKTYYRVIYRNKYELITDANKLGS